MKVICLVDRFSPDGVHRYNKGDVFELSEKSARSLAAMGKVQLEGESVKREEKKKYQRRDMRAEK